MNICIHTMPPFTFRFYICLGIFTVMFGVSVVSLNTQGLDSLKTKLIADIVFLQDIHTISSEEDTWKLIWRGNILFSHLSSNTAGIAICFSNKLDHHDFTWSYFTCNCMHPRTKLSFDKCLCSHMS
jgi:hypothetical protein